MVTIKSKKLKGILSNIIIMIVKIVNINDNKWLTDVTDLKRKNSSIKMITHIEDFLNS